MDKRTDIWSFGCVLFEMLTGGQTFSRETLTDTLVAIVEHSPDWNLLPSATPAPVRTLLRRCLQKTSARRLRDIGDARMELTDALGEPEGEPAAGAGAVGQPGRSRLSRYVGVAEVLVLGTVVGFIAGRLTNDPGTPTGPASVALLPLAYDGPEGSAYLAQLVPLVLSEELRASTSLQVAPFESSRTFAPSEDADLPP